MQSSADGLEVGVSNLRNQFRQTFDCLEVLRTRLEADLEGKYPSNLNPIRLNHRINKLQRTIEQLNQRVESMTNRKREMIASLTNTIAQQYNDVSALRIHSGLVASGIPANVTHDFAQQCALYQSFVNNNDGNNTNIDNTIDTNATNTNTITDEFECDQPMMGDTDVGYNNDCPNQMDIAMDDSFGLDSDEPTFGVTQDMFDSLSKHIRQRAKLSQLNDTYNQIFDAFMEQPKSKKGSRKPITLKQMAQKGVLVTGQTGQAIVNCLRQLKLVTVTKYGIELPKPYPVKPTA